MKIFITGGAGFIGANVAAHHMRRGDEVIVFDNLSRAGTRGNLAWLIQHREGNVAFVNGDVRDFTAVQAALPRDIDVVYHFAAQVAVTTSVRDPREDFEINALGTFNVLEAVRQQAPDAIVLYASTNKVYGGMETVEVVEDATRYCYRDLPLGIREDQRLDFHSPYGCSKGAGDQYVRDYARIYGMRTVVMRQSCIYGTRQFGVEDQGWIAHFCIWRGWATRSRSTATASKRATRCGSTISSPRTKRPQRTSTEPRVRSTTSAADPSNSLSIWREFGPLLERISRATAPSDVRGLATRAINPSTSATFGRPSTIWAGSRTCRWRRASIGCGAGSTRTSTCSRTSRIAKRSERGEAV